MDGKVSRSDMPAGMITEVCPLAAPPFCGYDSRPSVDKPKLKLDSFDPPADPEDGSLGGVGDDEPRAEAGSGGPRARSRDGVSFVQGLLDLPTLFGNERRTAFRQVVAELSRQSFEDGPSPLEGVRPEALALGVASALESGLCDDLDWLDPGAAGSALFQLAAALPVGAEQRDLGRRALARLLAGNADTFVTMATPMARAGGKGLLAPPVMARVALLVELPIMLELPDAALAFAIASRRSLAREYIVQPSTRSLPERRLAARLLERAARDALRRAQRGDRSGLRLVGPEGSLADVWTRLSSDREPLVWRHVAIARGMLLSVMDGGAEALDRELSAEQTITEWRRAAAALGGFAAARPDEAIHLAQRAFGGGLLERDPGAIAPYYWGLTRAAETEPEAARELFGLAAGGSAEDVADAVISLARELGRCAFVEDVELSVQELLSGSVKAGHWDDGAVALRAELGRALDHTPREDEPLGAQLDRALYAFAQSGAKAAHECGLGLLEAARGSVDALLAIGDDMGMGTAGALARRTSFSVVRDLDHGLLERDVLMNLLRLDNKDSRVKNAEQAVEHLRDKVFHWVVERELSPKVANHRRTTSSSGTFDLTQVVELPHLTLHLARLRALLHLVDGEGLGRSDEGDTVALRRFRVAARALIRCFGTFVPPPLRRAMMATFARSLDAIVRIGACDVSDVLLVAAASLTSPKDLDTLAEASMDPDTRDLLRAFSAVVSGRPPPPASRNPGDSLFPVIELVSLAPPAGRPDLAALELLTEQLAEVGTARSDGLRAVLMKLGQALASVAAAKSLRHLSALGGGDAGVAMAIETAVFHLSQLHAGARARVLDLASEEAPRVASRQLSTTWRRALERGEPLPEGASLAAAQVLTEGLSPRLAALVIEIASLADALPLDHADEAPRRPIAPVELPAWIPPRRTLGAFYVERPLAAGGVGSVFVVTRVEDRHDPEAERFALKVPDYNANAARTLSEAEFLAIFRGEASALMSIPSQENLARFVTFDLAARPKPILVMELVEGPNLERLIDTRMFDFERAVHAIDHVAAGLTAMHGVGVGHLDLKPANVVLRRGANAVLVDFGLAGRNIRPGCGSAPYSAPEVWGYEAGEGVTPMAADVYSFACLAFETLTGQLLFDAENEVQMVTQHMAHDGLPPKLRRFASTARFTPIAELLFSALRRDPSQRLAIGDLREGLARVLPKLDGEAWPLPA